MKKLIILLILCLSLPHIGFAEESIDDKTFFNLIYRDFKKIEKFTYIHIALSGSAEEIGINKEELTNFLKLRFKNNFAGMQYDDVDITSTFRMPDEEQEKFGYLWCKIWTVDNDYPIAYHIKCDGGNHKNLKIWSTAFLGYGNKSNVPESAKKALTEAVEQFAVTFFKARGEL